MRVDVVLGLQWGDEGKGKIVDVLAGGYPVVARFQGGPNAGHTLYYEGRKVVLHQVPSGIFHAGVFCVIADGVVLDPETLLREVEGLRALGIVPEERLILGEGVHLILRCIAGWRLSRKRGSGLVRLGEVLGLRMQTVMPGVAFRSRR